MSVHYSFICRYYNILNNYKIGKVLLPDHKVFEYVAAIKLNMIMWEDILNIPEARLNTQYSVDDSGIDIISYDLTVAGQVKYVNSLTWEQLTTFDGFCDHLEVVSKRLVIIRHDTTLSSRVQTICKIIRLNMVDELNSIPTVTINKQLKYSKLSVDGKIQELIEFGCKPKTNDKFSDGQNMYSFWNSIKQGRKLNLATYTKLREVPFVMNRFMETEDDFQIQINSLLKYIDDHISITKIDTIDYKLYDKFIIWNECKLQRKCEHQPWVQLLDNFMLKKDYYDHLKTVDLDMYNLATQIDELVEFIEEGINIFEHDIWMKCVNENLIGKWPYTNLFEYLEVIEVYILMTTNFPISTYNEIYRNVLKEDSSGMFMI